LATRVAQIAKGERVEPTRDRLRYEQLRQNVLDDYQSTERRGSGGGTPTSGFGFTSD
jgi:hypothetical protein